MIVFFASLMATLYYLGIMQRVVSVLGGLLHRLLGTSRTESMSAVANIFMGHTEAPLVDPSVSRRDHELRAVRDHDRWDARPSRVR